MEGAWPRLLLTASANTMDHTHSRRTVAFINKGIGQQRAGVLTLKLVGNKTEFLQNAQVTQLGGDDAWHRRTGERQGRGVSGKI